MSMSELDAINGVLRMLGEQPVATVDTQYPTLDLVLPALEDARLGLLGEGWYFNTFPGYAISPDTAGNILVPQDTLGFVPDDRNLRWSGKYVRKNDGSLIFDTKVRGTRYADLPFIELPHFAQRFIVADAALRVYNADFGQDQNGQPGIQRERTTAYNMLGRDHIRATRANVRDRPHIQRYYRSLIT